MERRNGKGARVMGINLEGKMAYSWMQIQAGANFANGAATRRQSNGARTRISPRRRRCSALRTYMAISPLPSRP